MAMISVVIPAHNEASVIGELLDALRPGVDDGRLEVIVVTNGCADATAEIARSSGVAVVDLPEAGKPGALNAGDAAVSAFPRFYVDADVVVSPDDLEALAAELVDGILAVAPARRIDSAGASAPVRAYHRIWDGLDSTTDSLAGRGCYGVSEAGRGRWGDFPDLLADDGYVNARFAPHERVVSDAVHTTIATPPDVRALLARKRRSHQGNVELERNGADVTSPIGWLSVIRRQPARLIDAPAYVAITLAARWLARRDRRAGTTRWGTDR